MRIISIKGALQTRSLSGSYKAFLTAFDMDKLLFESSDWSLSQYQIYMNNVYSDALVTSTFFYKGKISGELL